MIDIHSHVLYGLDDGAKTVEQSLEMLRVAFEAGTTDLVATPHANGRYRFDPELIELRIAELQAQTEVRIHRGCDFHLQYDNIQQALADPNRFTVNHQGYLLVEFPDTTVYSGSDDILLQLLDAGMFPIVTHPERNSVLQKRVADIARWIEMGCYVQVTAGSILGRFGGQARSFAFELLDRGLVQFVASDAHDASHRPPRLDEAFTALVERYGEETIRPLFFDNPAAVLSGEIVDNDVVPRRRPKQWWEFWR